ncbi:MAG: hypothetical protein IMZ62_01395 [Chloroflexi bacterium]|nr:hypothetical protein [Chloroflexota bacterium]
MPVWKGGQARDAPRELWCPVCGRKTHSEIKEAAKEVTACVGPHSQSKALTWISRRFKAIAITLCVIAVLYLSAFFADCYFSVGGAERRAVLTRPLARLLEDGYHDIVMCEDGQWDGKIEYVRMSWWGLKEDRYPMRFGPDPDSDEASMVWQIKYNGVWQSFFVYPEPE